MFPLFLSLKYLKPKRSVASVVTLISIAGVVLGVAIIIIVRAVMTGFGDMWQEKILSFKPHIIVSSWSGSIQNEENICQRIEATPGVIAAAPGIEMQVLAEHRRRIEAPLIEGTDPVRIKKLLPNMQMLSGDFNIQGDNIILGVDLAAKLGVHVGSQILIYSPLNLTRQDEIYFPEKLTIAGIYQIGQHNFDSSFIFTSLAVARDLVGIKFGTYSIHVRVDQPQNMAKFDALLATLTQELGPAYRLRNWREVDKELFNALAVEKNMMVILLMFIVIVAIFCVTNTLIVITVQKTNEIGLLKALGFSSQQIMLTFVLHGLIQCLIGTLLGIGLALIVLANLQNLIVQLAHIGIEVFPPGIYGLSELPYRIIPSEIVKVAAAVILFCSIASFLPAWRAARMDPAEALRNE